MEAQVQTMITTTQKIKSSSWKRGSIMVLLGLHPNKFATKMRYNDWDDQEISKLKKHKVIQ